MKNLLFAYISTIPFIAATIAVIAVASMSVLLVGQTLLSILGLG